MSFKSLLFLTLFSQLVSGQKSKIDDLLDKSFEEYGKYNIVTSNQLANQALKLSISYKYDEGIAKSHIYIAKILNTLDYNDKAINHLNELEKTESFKNNPILQAENCRIRGRAYSNLKMYDLSIKEFQKQLKISESIQDEHKKNFSKLFTHENLIQVFKIVNKKDSIWKHIKAQEPILKKYKEKEVYYYISTMYVQTADELITLEKYGEAKRLLSQSLDLLKKYDAASTFFTYLSLGNLEYAQNNNVKAIDYYKKGLENAIETNNTTAKINFYKKLANLYSINNLSSEKANQFYKKHIFLQDSINQVNQKTQNSVVQYIINTKVDTINNKHKKTTYLFIFISSIGITISILLFKKFKKYRILNYNKEIQKQRLELELKDNNFENLIQLAKQNNPEFLILFQQLYPNFISKLKSTDPNVRSSELTFCAMAFLNFSTKDIAEYTFVTVRAVQIRKNRLRKKYNIPSDKDFNIWMQNIDI